MARKKDESLFDMFQDPIMTMVAMILLATLWMILPGQSQEKTKSYYDRKESIDSLQDIVNVYDKEINMLEIQLRRMKRDCDWTTEKVANLPDTHAVTADSARDDVARSLDECKDRIRRRKEDLRRVEQLLARARKKAEHSPLGESIRSLHQEMNAADGLLDKKMRELVDLENRRIEAQHRKEERASELGRLKSLYAELQQEVSLKSDKQQRLEKELEAMGNDANPVDVSNSPGSITEMESTDKKIFYLQLKNSALLPLDEMHYSTRNGHIKMDNGSMVAASEYTPLSSAEWETAPMIAQSGSDFQTALEKLDAHTYCIIFLVDTRSFPLFRKAREIARKKGFELGWQPFTNNNVVLVSRGKDDDIEIEKRN